MPSVRCICGARYKFAEEHRGRRSKCKQCGNIFVLEIEETGPIPIADEPRSPSPGSAIDVTGLEGLSFDGPRIDTTTGTVPALDVPSPTLAVRPSAAGEYVKRLGWALLFFTAPQNFIVLLILWFVVGVALPFTIMLPMGVFGIIITVIVYGLYFGYLFEIVRSGTAGEDRLPDLGYEGDFVEEIVSPLVKWLASWLLILAPAIVYILNKIYVGEEFDEQSAYLLFVSTLTDLPRAFETEPVAAVLVIAGYFFWPMVVLCAAAEGFQAMLRVDLMVMTVARSLVGYLITVACFLAASIAVPAVHWAVQQGIGAASSEPQGWLQVLLIAALLDLVGIYAWIVALLAIGLYFRHYRHRFAFDWGQ